MIEKHCLECHNQDRRKGGLSLATYGDALEGGRTGAVIRPGGGARSLLIHRVTGAVEPQMPKDETPLTAAEIALIQRWIDQGARRNADVAGGAATVGGRRSRCHARSTPRAGLAALVGAARPVCRRVLARSAGCRNRRRLATRSSRAAPISTRGVCCLTPEELQAFLDDRRPGKRAALVDRLLADNDKYAEHWISFWNDLLRNEDGVSYFSETGGPRRASPTGCCRRSTRTFRTIGSSPRCSILRRPAIPRAS